MKYIIKNRKELYYKFHQLDFMQKRGNHRRTRSTIPEELNKILAPTSLLDEDRLGLQGSSGSVLIPSNSNIGGLPN